MGPYAYAIDSARGDGYWWNVVKWAQEDPWPLTDFEVRVLNPNIAYFFRMTYFGVTVDGGKNWHLFDAYSTMTDRDKIKRFDNHEIPRVSIDADGTGSIYLQDYYDKNGSLRVIYETTDFGQTWALTTN